MDRTLSQEVHQLLAQERTRKRRNLSCRLRRRPRETESRAFTWTRQQHFLIAPAQNSRNAAFLMRAVLLHIFSTIAAPEGSDGPRGWEMGYDERHRRLRPSSNFEDRASRGPGWVVFQGRWLSVGQGVREMSRILLVIFYRWFEAGRAVLDPFVIADVVPTSNLGLAYLNEQSVFKWQIVYLSNGKQKQKKHATFCQEFHSIKSHMYCFCLLMELQYFSFFHFRVF